MLLKNLNFECEVCPDRDGNSDKRISLENKDDKYYLKYGNGNTLCIIDISGKIDKLYQGLLAININEWNQKCFDGPMDMYPSYLWRLEVLADDIHVFCKGIDNFPKNWDEFKKLLFEIGIDADFFH